MDDFDIYIEEQNETSASGVAQTSRTNVPFTATIDDSFNIEISIDESYEADFGRCGIENLKESITDMIRDNSANATDSPLQDPLPKVRARRKKR